MVGAEGVLGVAMMAGVVLPLAQAVAPGTDAGGCMENTSDSLAMVAATPHLLALLACYIGGVMMQVDIG